jgi:hypothetical protein
MPLTSEFEYYFPVACHMKTLHHEHFLHSFPVDGEYSFNNDSLLDLVKTPSIQNLSLPYREAFDGCIGFLIQSWYRRAAINSSYLIFTNQEGIPLLKFENTSIPKSDLILYIDLTSLTKFSKTEQELEDTKRSADRWKAIGLLGAFISFALFK